MQVVLMKDEIVTFREEKEESTHIPERSPEFYPELQLEITSSEETFTYRDDDKEELEN